MSIDVSDRALEILAPTLIGFMKRYDDVRYALAGSGTFVSVGEIKGILTAAHVLDVLPQGPIGAMVFSRPSRRMNYKIQVYESDKVYLSGWKETKALPDIGFLRIAREECARLEGLGCVFHDLTKPRTHFDHSDGAADTQRFVCGVVGESAEEGGMYAGADTIGYTSLAIAAKNIRWQKDGLAEIEPDFDEHVRAPESYKGVSGGGFWSLGFYKKHGSEELLSERKLVGVAFRQTQITEAGRTIFCQSGMTLQADLMNAIYAAFDGPPP